MIDLKVKRVTDTSILPVFGSKGAACFDLHADLNCEGVGTSTFVDWAVFRTGLKFEIPEGYAMLVYSRSGHGFNNNIRLANCVGIIDSDYTGEVKVKLTVDGDHSFTVTHGDRIAQAMLIPVPSVNIQEVTELKVTERGENGFGSTGVGILSAEAFDQVTSLIAEPANPTPELQALMSRNNVVTAEEEAAAHPIMTSQHLK